MSENFRETLFDKLERFMFDEESGKYKFYGRVVAETKDEFIENLEFLWPVRTEGPSGPERSVSTTIKAFFFLDSVCFGFSSTERPGEGPSFEDFLDDIGIVFPFPFFVGKPEGVEEEEEGKGEY